MLRLGALDFQLRSPTLSYSRNFSDLFHLDNTFHMRNIRVRDPEVTPWLGIQVRAHLTQTSALVSEIIAYRDEQHEATCKGR